MWSGHMLGAGGFGLGHWLWWALLVAGAVALVRWLVRGADSTQNVDPGRALAILKERYARGEIDQAEFQARRRDLG